MTKEVLEELERWTSSQLTQHDNMTLTLPPSNKGWGASYLGQKTGGRWQQEKAKAHINVFGNESNSSLCQEHFITSIPHLGPDGQLHCCVLHKQTRGNTITVPRITCFRDMDIRHLTSEMAYRGACSRCLQHRSGFCLKELQQSNGVDTGQGHFPEHNESIHQAESGSICIKDQQSVTTVCIEVPRSGSPSNRCISSELEPVVRVSSCSDSLQRVCGK